MFFSLASIGYLWSIVNVLSTWLPSSHCIWVCVCVYSCPASTHTHRSLPFLSNRPFTLTAVTIFPTRLCLFQLWLLFALIHLFILRLMFPSLPFLLLLLLLDHQTLPLLSLSLSGFELNDCLFPFSPPCSYFLFQAALFRPFVCYLPHHPLHLFSFF